MFSILEREQMIQAMRDELTRAGVRELRTAEEVRAALTTAKGVSVVFVNSVCGCAAGKARPGFVMSLQNEIVPDNLFTVFAGQDKEATEEARKFFTNQPPSSPSIAFLKDGQFMGIIHRHQIEARSAEMIAMELKNIYNKYCTKRNEAAAV
ncbi:MAG: BrxA/BrxB family bacilliredoxin [Chloroherpetonaceae bacterium]|nr:BrxA/BrxB family bacilliredoxin [Chloroherpetonaceae bacterium]MCS7210460.1 BrxA/BrxB family bacilliredoxin [Chloroherpetonaceae bacterium]MDW8020303.1 BrxA/BrxB family bacilliredoxin [Chloroherpetonaceae bacterium]MDW8466501.1 BrxA/BrxB family bacilliredoxin [Chloroherpetonaceae bacterium]